MQTFGEKHKEEIKKEIKEEATSPAAVRGLVHLYSGDGKGKTTAAMGLALRALGNGRRVVLVQFLKGEPSGEVALLRQLGAQVLRDAPGMKFVFQMDEAEKQAAREAQNERLRTALAEQADLLILDEACAAVRLGMVDEALLRGAVQNKPYAQELVLTGRDPAEWMLEAADYHTEMQCRRHPYQKGIAARRGVEF
jgi:cob(I)alamin adenosyltransferase